MKFLVIFYNFMGISPDPRSCAQILVTSFCPLHPPVMERGIRISAERGPSRVSAFAAICVVGQCCLLFAVPSPSCRVAPVPQGPLFPLVILVASTEAVPQACVALIAFAVCFPLSCVLMFSGGNLIKKHKMTFCF